MGSQGRARGRARKPTDPRTARAGPRLALLSTPWGSRPAQGKDIKGLQKLPKNLVKGMLKAWVRIEGTA